MEKKIVLMVITNLNFGGAQRVFYNLSRELSSEYKVVECVFNFDAGHAFKSGNEVISLDVKGGNNWLSKIFQFYKRCQRLRIIKRQLKPAVCISHLEGADYVNVLSRTQEKVICCVHGSKLHDENIENILGWIRKVLLIPFLYRKADAVVTVSEGAMHEMTDHFGIAKEKTLWIPNFFYPKQIEDQSKKQIPELWESIFTSRPIIITVGRLTRQKNQRAFVRIAAAYQKLKPSKWVLVGDGECKEDLINLCSQEGLRSYVANGNNSVADADIYFLGYYENPFALTARADWFLLTSAWEGFPMVIGETMALGVPVISTDCNTGPREFLSRKKTNEKPVTKGELEDFGILLPVIDENCEQSEIDRLAEWLVAVTHEPELKLRYQKMGKKRIETFSVEKIVPKWLYLIESL